MFQNKKFLRFLLVTLVFYILWIFIYDLWLKPTNLVDFQLTYLLTDHTVYILNLIGYPVFHLLKNGKNYIMSQQQTVLVIANACNGLVLYPLFIGFIIAIPGKVKDMIGMILIGSFIIYITNLARAVFLCIIRIHYPEYLDFNHRYTFLILVYGVIFLLWIKWISKYSYLKSLKTNEKY